MFQRDFILGALLPAIMLFASIGVDIYKTAATRPSVFTAASSKTIVPEPGPRRYPPGYRPAASLAH